MGSGEQSADRLQLQRLTAAVRSFAESATDHQRLLDTIARSASELLGCFCTIALASDDGQWVDPAAVYDPDAAQRHWDAMERFFGAKLG